MIFRLRGCCLHCVTASAAVAASAAGSFLHAVAPVCSQNYLQEGVGPYIRGANEKEKPGGPTTELFVSIIVLVDHNRNGMSSLIELQQQRRRY